MKLLFTFTLFLLTLIACQSAPPCSSISGTYSGTSVMGSSSGTCSMQINSDCSAVLVYDHGNLGRATDKGALEKTDAGYSFTSTSGGGIYEIQVNGNRLVLEGYNWRCEMGNE